MIYPLNRGYFAIELIPHKILEPFEVKNGPKIRVFYGYLRIFTDIEFQAITAKYAHKISQNPSYSEGKSSEHI